jgi:hypothetical protein
MLTSCCRAAGGEVMMEREVVTLSRTDSFARATGPRRDVEVH